ncbi:aldehyde dehydrogenase (NADP(+)) [Roseibium salinum]|uniref:Aldehyde dehydrogenase (NADP(+)) n=1 Tax=Roseibium salinum TaxID=1604349 RepID=A0ABT3R0C8_9HYPH|nr:aldehyde dehydrogenase (NADP(+)) [Roseibium sp. DSM 29163]MCX2722566.1 aldehyde dehydrogenase (NADP(+)) [Roseibium sp. DSM 29163]
MSFTPKGKHLIAGEWVSSEETFSNLPMEGEAARFAEGTPADIDQAAQTAEEAFWSFSASSRADRAAFLNKIADEIEARGDAITAIGTVETGLPAARLQGERGRTTGQLRLFAQFIEDGDYLDRRHDEALPDRKPLPRPDLRLMQRPVGPVGVFGASNFPLAFSTAGGDTASALAAGCPVVVKGHPAHPGTAEIVAEAILAAIEACNLHKGVFSLVQGSSKEVGAALVQHPLIKAVGFTGSLGAGRALFDLCASRPEPIPFFGELGSVNPIFLLPEALKSRGETIGVGWAASLSMGTGQFCTNPGVSIAVEGPDADACLEAATAALVEVGEQAMLTPGIANAFEGGQKRIAATSGVREVLKSGCSARGASPYLYATTGAEWLANEELGEEVFGPLGIFVTVKDFDEMVAVAKSFQGQLTATLHMDRDDTQKAGTLVPILERKAGRILVSGFPTGVEVSDAMVHGGPYPASTNFGATSVGTMAIRRFLRPVCYQNFPDGILPADLA